MAGIPTSFEQDPVKGFQGLPEIVNLVVNLVYGLSVALIVIFLVLSGIRYISSGGDKEGVASAKRMLTGSVVGFIVAISAWTLKTIIEKMLLR